MKKNVLVIGGGGAKSLAHLGVYEILKKNGLKIDHIVSTSSGSLMSVLFSAGVVVEDIKREFFSLRRRLTWFFPSFRNMGYLSDFAVRKILKKLVPYTRIEQLPIPVTMVAANITKLNQVVINRGDILSAVNVVSSYPIFYRPRYVEGDILIDGGILNSDPADIAKSIAGEGKVVTITLSSPFNLGKNAIDSRMDIVHRSLFYHMEINRRAVSRKNTDIMLRPLRDQFYNIGTWKGIFEFYSVKKMKKYYELGKKEAIAHLDELKQVLK